MRRHEQRRVKAEQRPGARPGIGLRPRARFIPFPTYARGYGYRVLGKGGSCARCRRDLEAISLGSPPRCCLSRYDNQMVLGDLIRERATLDHAQFRAKYPSPALLRRGGDDAERVDCDFKTTLRTLRSIVPSEGRPISAADNDARLIVMFIAKRPGGAFASQIGVGRTLANDLFLPDPKVSKYHAYFTWDPVRSICILTDAKARNGTFVNRQRLPEGSSATLEDGTLIDFGTLRLRFHTPDGLYGILSVHVPVLAKKTV